MKGLYYIAIEGVIGVGKTSLANLLAEKQLSEKINSKNSLKLAYGQTYSQFINADGDREWSEAQKTTDLIDAESMERFTLGGFIDPYAAFRLESQFLDESVPDDKKMFNPITLTESFGIAKVFIKEENKELSTRLGGAFKQFINSHLETNIDYIMLIYPDIHFLDTLIAAYYKTTHYIIQYCITFRDEKK